MIVRTFSTMYWVDLEQKYVQNFPRVGQSGKSCLVSPSIMSCILWISIYFTIPCSYNRKTKQPNGPWWWCNPRRVQPAHHTTEAASNRKCYPDPTQQPTVSPQLPSQLFLTTAGANNPSLQSWIPISLGSSCNWPEPNTTTSIYKWATIHAQALGRQSLSERTALAVCWHWTSEFHPHLNSPTSSIPLAIAVITFNAVFDPSPAPIISLCWRHWGFLPGWPSWGRLRGKRVPRFGWSTISPFPNQGISKVFLEGCIRGSYDWCKKIHGGHWWNCL